MGIKFLFAEMKTELTNTQISQIAGADHQRERERCNAFWHRH